MKSYKDKYRSDTNRLKGYDYSSEGMYFVTICTRNRIPYFGSINDGIMQLLSSAGKIVANEWKQTGNIRLRVVLGEWIVMPNHFHGIIYLKPKNHAGRGTTWQALPLANAYQKDIEDHTKDGCNPSLQKVDIIQDYKNEFGPQQDNISSVIRGFKSSCTRKIRNSGIGNFAWQRRFYDHIIRSQNTLTKIEEYIRENPVRWFDDRYYSTFDDGLHAL